MMTIQVAIDDLASYSRLRAMSFQIRWLKGVEALFLNNDDLVLNS